MNVELLKEFCEKILEFEDEYEVQNYLNNLRSSLDGLASNPQDQGQQTNVSQSLSSLGDAIKSFESEFSPKEKQRFTEIRAEEFFTSDFLLNIKSYITENAMSPAVVRDHVNKFAKLRNQFIENLKTMLMSFEKIGIEIDDLEEDQTQIGFQIPREIFKNNLDGFIVELREVKFIVRTISEVTTGQVEDIQVGQISTSDPLIFLGQSIPVALAIAKIVDWALAKWKEVEEIRLIRAQTAQIKHFTKKEIENTFDKKITELVDKAIEEKCKELLNASDVERARKNELQKALKDSLSSLFARIERGMTIEIRMLPYEEEEADEVEAEELGENAEIYSAKKELFNTQAQLKFPEPSESPVLQLTSHKKNEQSNHSQ